MQSSGQVCWCDSPDDDWNDAADYINSNCAADYLIIVADELLADAADSSLVEQLAAKRAEFNGFNVAIARMGQIDSTPDNATTPTLIRNFVEAIYDAQTAGHMEDERLGFLLLLGDALNPSGQVILPTHVPFPNDYNGNQAQGAENGSDAFYVLLDGTGDLIPDVLVGRLPVDADESDWELGNVVSKITSYEPISPSSTWTDKILLMSGGDDEKFTFDGEGLSGFEEYFDAIEGLVPNSGKTFTQMHRLAASSDSLFSKAVCDEIVGSYSVVGLFDHANPVNFFNAFYPVHYDTIQNSSSPSLVLSFGSYSGFFDRVLTGWCCPDPSYSGLPCKSPVTPIDDCDALVERLVVQPAGAIGVIAYGRTHQAPIVQQVFANAFRALLQHKQGQLGSLLLATKLMSGDYVTSKALNLLGDPALNIDYQFDTVAQDSIDLSVSGLDMEFVTARHDFGSSSGTQSLEVTVSNLWRDDASSVPVEVWRGPPDEGGSALLNSFTLSSVPAHGSASWTGSIGSFSAGDYDIYVSVDPNNDLDDPVRANNVSYRTLHVRNYASGFPREALYAGVEVLDAVLGSPRQLEISTGGTLYTANGTSLGWVGRGPGGNLHRSNKRHFASPELFVGGFGYVFVYEAGSSNSTYFAVPGTIQSPIVVDQGLPDSMLVAVLTTDGTDRKIRLHGLSGQTKWVRKVGDIAQLTFHFGAFAMASGDVTGDGAGDIVYTFSPSLGAALDSVIVLDGVTGARVWSTATGSEKFDRAYVRLLDIENDGQLEILTNTRVSGAPPEDRILCYGSSGSLLWHVTSGEVEGSSQPPTFLAPADLDNDGVKEIVFTHGIRLGVIGVSGSVATVTYEVNLSDEIEQFSAPLAADIDGDDLLEIIVFRRARHHYLNEYYLELQVYTDDLTLLTPSFSFPWVSNLSAPSIATFDAAAGDIDGDGVIEIVFTTPDATLHAVRVGTTAGREDWTSAYGSAMRQSLYEQVLGGTYDKPVAVPGRARVLADATFTAGLTITAPADVRVGALDSLIVQDSFAILGSSHDSVRVRIDDLASPGSYWGGIVYGDAADHGIVRHAVVTDALVALESESPLEIIHSRIANVSNAAVIAADTLWFENSDVVGSSGLGIRLDAGAVGRIDESSIQNTDSTGILCDGCAVGSVINGTTIQTAGHHGIHLIGNTGWDDTPGVTIDSCTVEVCGSAGIYFDLAHGTVSECHIEGAQVGIATSSGPGTVTVDATEIVASAIGAEADAPLRIASSSIANVASAAVIAGDTLWFESSSVSVSAGLGIHLTSGAVGWVDNSQLDDVDLTAIFCDSCAAGTVIEKTTIGSAGLHGIHALATTAMVIDSCVVTGSSYNGIRFESADGLVTKCRLESNGGGVVCLGTSSPVVEETKINANGGGVAAADDSYPVLGYGSVGGNNCITNAPGYNVTNLSDPYIPIYARHDYWGAVCCKKFFGYVECDSCVTSSACAAAALVQIMPLSVSDRDDNLPRALDLVGAAPNPFNPTVRIRFAVPAPGARVRMTVYNVRGQRVADLEDGLFAAGYHDTVWNGTESRGAPAASGIYFVQMKSGGFRKAMKIVLLK